MNWKKINKKLFKPIKSHVEQKLVIYIGAAIAGIIINFVHQEIDTYFLHKSTVWVGDHIKDKQNQITQLNVENKDLKNEISAINKKLNLTNP